MSSPGQLGVAHLVVEWLGVEQLQAALVMVAHWILAWTDLLLVLLDPLLVLLRLPHQNAPPRVHFLDMHYSVIVHKHDVDLFTRCKLPAGESSSHAYVGSPTNHL